MAGLTVLLETHKSHHHPTTTNERPLILVKSSLLRHHHPTPTPPQPLSSTLTSSFLQSCYLCRRNLSHEKDIYMYRGDRAFCSVECRRNQILMDEESLPREKNSIAASSCVSHHRKGGNKSRAATTAKGGFAY